MVGGFSGVNMRAYVVGFALALAACGEAAAPPASEAAAIAAPDPAPLVREIYTPYLAADGAPPALLEAAPWSRRTRQEITDMQANSMAMGEPILDFDPLINAQDWQLSNVSAETETQAGGHAVVRASFFNAGRQEDLRYDLIWEDDGWKVENVRGADWDLRTIITAPIDPPEPAAP